MVVVNKSTVPIGSGNWVESIVRDAYEKRTNKKAKGVFAVASNPEFLREGSAIFDSLYPDRVVVGSDNQRTAEVLYSLYRPLLEQTFNAPSYLPRPERMGAVPLISADLASAELIKYAANAFLALKISYINEIGQLAEKVGADITQVAKGIGLDARIGTRFLQAGIGWGGSCFGKDTAALVATAGEYGLDAQIVKAAREINRRQRERVVEKLLDELKILKGRTVGTAGPGVQTRHRRPARSAGARHRPQADRTRRAREGATIRSPWSGFWRNTRIWTSPCARLRRPWPRMPTRWCWSPNGSSIAISTGSRSRTACALRWCSTDAITWIAPA